MTMTQYAKIDKMLIFGLKKSWRYAM